MVGTRELTVLGEFKPFGLIAEAVDGKAPDGSESGKYDYFLFDPDSIRERDELLGAEDGPTVASSPTGGSDHELFISGNRLIWSSGSRVQKRYSCSNSILMACWCRLDSVLETFLCVLQSDTLSIYNASGEVACIPLRHVVISIWPLPFGLLLQKAADLTSPISLSSTSSNLSLNPRESCGRSKEFCSGQYALNLLNSCEVAFKEDACAVSSHMILRHPLEEAQVMYVEERGKLSAIKEFDERTIWTSNSVPLLASYHSAKAKHSIWIIELINCNGNGTNSTVDMAVDGPFSKEFSFRRIWQGKCSQSAASKIFMATGDDGLPVLCFLLQQQKQLLSVELQIEECDNEAIFDVKPHLTWSIPAVDAAPVIVTRPRIKIGRLPFSDIIVLTSDNNLLLYSGKQCLCKYVLPTGLMKISVSHLSQCRNMPSMRSDFMIVGVCDAIQGRINVIAHDGKIFRCALRRDPSSSLANDCITAMSEGLRSSLYNHFLLNLWGDGKYMSNVDSGADSEWLSFVNTTMKMCKEFRSNGQIVSQILPETSWNFLLGSKFHFEYCKHVSIACLPGERTIDLESTDCMSACTTDEQIHVDKAFCDQVFMETLDALHALYESLKLDSLRKFDLELLAHLLCKVAVFLGEMNYVDHYVRDFPDISLEDQRLCSSAATRYPPCIFGWLESCLRNGCEFANSNNLPPLICKEKSSVVSWARKIVSFYSILLGAERTGRKLSSGVYCDIARGSTNTTEEATVLAMVAENFGLQQLDLLPAGVSLPLRHALDKCRECPPNDWPAAAYVLVGREDLARLQLASSHHPKEQESKVTSSLISVSVPYALRLQPVTIPSSTFSLTRPDATKVDDSDSVNTYFEDGMEHMFNSSSQLRYGRDLRLNEVRRLLCSARPVAVQTSINTNTSDQDQQQHQLWSLAQRTTALPLGRGAFTLSSTYTLLTEALIVPKFVLAGRLPAQQNATVNLDPNLRNIPELRSWAEFHNGVAAGLRLAPFQGKISRTWIHYNKPVEPNATHAGVLLALGLHGHLCVFTITDIYRYLSQEHDTTTLGILLGIAASHRGTMDPAISKMFYLHIPSRHPSSFPDLELPTLLQSAALMSIGILYEGSAHPLTMKILMGEIGRRSGGDNVLEREGYAVAAGFALGLVALGRGQDAFGVMETFVDRLFQFVGGKDFYSERFFKFGQASDDQNCTPGQMLDGAPINVDVTSPGSTIAIALIFLKTESDITAARLSIPATHFDLQYVRPDFIMLRIIARNMILWSRIQPSKEWVDAQMPEIVRIGTSRIGDENSDNDTEALIQAYVNILTGACISIGLRFAGSRNADAQELLYNYAVYFLNEMKPICGKSCNFLPKGLLEYVDRGTLETCLHLVVLSLCVVMAGSGHLETFRLLRFLRKRSSVEGHISYGIHMAISLAIGFLFLGGGAQTFSTGNSAIAALLITLYPRLPTGPNDNRCHLQAFRHLYVIAAESRCIQTVDVDSGLLVYAPLEVTISETKNYAETSFCEVTPCILPERALLKTVRVCGPRYWPQIIELVPKDEPWWTPGDRNDPFNGGVIYIKRKVGACSYVDDPVGCQSLLSRAMHKVSDASALGNYVARKGNMDSAVPKFDQLITTFSADPSLISFARLCCDSWNSRSDLDFQEFCSQILFECVSKERPALLQVYISLYTNICSMLEQVHSGRVVFHDSLFLLSLKLAIAYNDAVTTGKLTSCRDGIVQPIFVDSIRKLVEEILNSSQNVKTDFYCYLDTGKWPSDRMRALVLSWYLQWYGVPASVAVRSALKKIKSKLAMSSSIPILHLILPRTHIHAINEIDGMKFS